MCTTIRGVGSRYMYEPQEKEEKKRKYVTTHAPHVAHKPAGMKRSVWTEERYFTPYAHGAGRTRKVSRQIAGTGLECWSGSIVRTFLGVFSVFSIGRSRALQEGVYSAGSKTVRVKRPRHDGYSAEPLLIWIAREKVCLSPFSQEWSAGKSRVI
jgi:hypothetical protein